MALAIMLYHFYGMGSDASTALGKLGIYGVSVFFILSGLSMAIAYDKYIVNIPTALLFFVRRLFRIWPLLWLAVALVAIPSYFLGKPFEPLMIFLNLSTLFGFIAPTQYINTGAWSIGNEMVYYALTPAIISLYRWRTMAGNALTLVASFISLFFAFFVLDSSSDLVQQWHLYINPLNNLFLYCVGLAIYYNARELELPSIWRSPILILVVALFFIYPTTGNAITLVTGFDRVALTLISIAIVVAFFKCSPTLPRFIGRPLEQLGLATYGVYLLHPIVMSYITFSLKYLGIQILHIPALIAVVFTIAISLLIFRFLESPMIALGKKITQLR
jgi:exopolysaccharide production protein ExoZ